MSTHDRIKVMLEQIKKTDPLLMDEILSKKSSAAFKYEAETIKNEMSEVADSGLESFSDESYLEAVILKVGRPVLIINKSEADLVFEEAESEIWRDRLRKAKSQLSISIPSVGRIGLQNHPQFDWCGTGWLIDNDVIITNRHVAEVFSFYNGQQFIFRQGINGQMTSDIDLLQEYNRPDKRIMKLLKVLHIEPEPGPDLAFIRVEQTNNMPAVIKLSDKKINQETDVAVIGYPAIDSRMPDVELMKKIFKDVYDKKRLAPGKITAVTESRLNHDCSTLGGCSGSAIIDLSNGQACGLHFAGRFLQANYAVPATIINERLNALKNNRLGRGISRNVGERTVANPQSASTTSSTARIVVPLSITISIDSPEDISISSNKSGNLKN